MSSDTTRATFAARLRAFRAARGLTVRALGERAQVSYQAVSRMENGHYEPSLAIAGRLADALGVTLDALAGRE